MAGNVAAGVASARTGWVGVDAREEGAVCVAGASPGPVRVGGGWKRVDGTVLSVSTVWDTR